MTITETTLADPVEAPVMLTFGGRFRFGIDRWAYVPFDVPPGVGTITVSTRHDRFALLGPARNVLDLGIFGPEGYDLGNVAGFRGWSGGARDGFTLSTAYATPGYLPSRIDPGRWTLALGPVVLNPLGMRWQAQVVLEPVDAAEDWCEAAATPAKVSGRGPGWYRGDLHTHTVHSDGRHRPEDVLAGARAAGLDFVVSTDHNTCSANRAIAASRTEGLLAIPGEEVTTRHGHWLAVGLPPGGWVDWRYAPRDNVFERFAAQVRGAGGIVVAAHPGIPLPGSKWEFGYRYVDAVEVWNGKWNLDDEFALRIWHRLLRSGRRVAAVGGSDSHAPHQRIGLPQTVVYARDLSTTALIGGLRAGRAYLAESSTVAVKLTASCRVGDRSIVAEPGQTLLVPPGAPVTVSAEVIGAPGTSLALVTAAGRVARIGVDDTGAAALRWTATDADPRFARVEVRRETRAPVEAMVALTNPVWLIR